MSDTVSEKRLMHWSCRDLGFIEVYKQLKSY